jgi:hypothetical protein
MASHGTRAPGVDVPVDVQREVMRRINEARRPRRRSRHDDDPAKSDLEFITKACRLTEVHATIKATHPAW